jgi:hypothetical protein
MATTSTSGRKPPNDDPKDGTRNEELPVGTCFALLVTSPLVTRPFHNLPTGKRAHNLLQHARWVTFVPVGGYFSVFTLVTRPTGNAGSYLIQKAI